MEVASPQLLDNRVFSLKTKPVYMALLTIFLLLYKRGLVGGWHYNQVSPQGAIFHHQIDPIEAMPRCRKRSYPSLTRSKGQTSNSSVYLPKASTLSWVQARRGGSHLKRPASSALSLFSGSSHGGCPHLAQWEQRNTHKVCFPQLWSAPGLEHHYPATLDCCPLPVSTFLSTQRQIQSESLSWWTCCALEHWVPELEFP